jgi:phage tail protein X
MTSASRRRATVIALSGVAAALAVAGGFAAFGPRAPTALPVAMPDPHPVVTVKVITNPPGASVYDGTRLVGVTPGSFLFPRIRGNVNLTFQLEGHLSGTRSIYLPAAPLDRPLEVTLNLAPR